MPWDRLGIAPTTDTRVIRRAYAVALKQTRPEDDAAGFEQLRAAYEHALAWARWQAESQADAPETDLVERDAAGTAQPSPETAYESATNAESRSRPLDEAAPRATTSESDKPVDDASPTPAQTAQPVHTVWQREQDAVSAERHALQRAAFDRELSDDELERSAAQYRWLDPDVETTHPADWLSRTRYRLYHLFARRAIDRIAAAMAQGETVALTVLRSCIAAPQWEVLDARDLFELGLATWLAEQQPLPYVLIEAAMHWAGWADAEGYPLAGISAPAAFLCQQRLLHVRWTAWECIAQPIGKSPDRFRQSVFRAVLGPQNPLQRWIAAHSTRRIAAVRQLLDEIEYGYPPLFAKLDQPSVQWWRTHWAPWASQYWLGWIVAVVVGVLVASLTAVVLDGNDLAPLGTAVGFALGGAAALYGGNLLARRWGQWLWRRAQQYPLLGIALERGFNPVSALAAWLFVGILAGSVAQALWQWPPYTAAWMIAIVGLIAQAAVLIWPERVVPPIVRRALAGGMVPVPTLLAGVFIGAIGHTALAQNDVAYPLPIALVMALAALTLAVVFYARRDIQTAKPAKRDPLAPPRTERVRSWWWLIWLAILIARFIASNKGHS